MWGAGCVVTACVGYRCWWGGRRPQANRQMLLVLVVVLWVVWKCPADLHEAGQRWVGVWVVWIW